MHKQYQRCWLGIVGPRQVAYELEPVPGLDADIQHRGELVVQHLGDGNKEWLESLRGLVVDGVFTRTVVATEGDSPRFLVTTFGGDCNLGVLWSQLGQLLEVGLEL